VGRGPYDRAHATLGDMGTGVHYGANWLARTSRSSRDRAGGLRLPLRRPSVDLGQGTAHIGLGGLGGRLAPHCCKAKDSGSRAGRRAAYPTCGRKRGLVSGQVGFGSLAPSPSPADPPRPPRPPLPLPACPLRLLASSLKDTSSGMSPSSSSPSSLPLSFCCSCATRTRGKGGGARAAERVWADCVRRCA
jgi:hypothetical protein